MPEYMEGQTAKNPQTGQRIVRKGGKWVPLTAPKLSAQEQIQLKQAREDAQAASSAARDGSRFLEINRETGTGQVWSVPMLSEARGAFDPRYAEMLSLTNRMAPAQRQAGSGAMSDKDVAMFKKSVPNTDFPGPTNQRIVQRLQDEAKRKGSYAEFLDAYALNNGTLAGAQEEWNKKSSRPAAKKPVRKPARAPEKDPLGLFK